MTETIDNQEFKIEIKGSFLNTYQGKLSINSEHILFKKKNLFKNNSIQFDKSEIKEYKLGIKWIRGYKFTIGRDYQIFIRNQKGKTLKISLKSFYGINPNSSHAKYIAITNALWEYHFGEIASVLFKKFKDNEEFTINNVRFTSENITIETNSFLKRKKVVIDWKAVQTKDYNTYFAIFSQKNPADINQCFSYKDDWNTFILYSVVRTILKNNEKP
ncbi:hypothetical protein [Flavobacterium humi]|uniref:Uncharacterized protein n=1 Tax=Flavobacterium humi TaxID=2562683 RepID=A0A4Z0L4L2_9FLAO|nr:hypothetical protein [Flavobacterium humi]TGD57179.1 hypothetical protein E4635_13510 [Flavobacterium humi]